MPAWRFWCVREPFIPDPIQAVEFRGYLSRLRRRERSVNRLALLPEHPLSPAGLSSRFRNVLGSVQAAHEDDEWLPRDPTGYDARMGSSRWDRKRVRSLIILLVVAAGLIGGFVALRLTGRLSMFSSQEALRTWVLGFGAAAPAVFFVVQVLQVIVSPIPGGLTTLVGAMLFGFWPAFGLSTAAVITGSLIAFGLARAFGRPLVLRLVGPKITERYLGAMTSRARIALLLMFLLPFFPDDALSLVAGLTGLSWSFFLLAVACTRPWGLLFSSMVGSGMVRISKTASAGASSFSQSKSGLSRSAVVTWMNRKPVASASLSTGFP